MEMQDKSK